MRTLKHTYTSSGCKIRDNIFLEEVRCIMKGESGLNIDEMSEDDQIIINNVILFIQKTCVELITQPVFPC